MHVKVSLRLFRLTSLPLLFRLLGSDNNMQIGVVSWNIMTPEKQQPIITLTRQGLLIAVQTDCYLSDAKVESALTSRFS